MKETLETNFKNPTTEIERQIARLGPWFHNLHLPGGVQTAPDHSLGNFPSYKWREIAPHIPKDLSGWTALDIGCNAGFYSFELARRGADVTAIDADSHYLKQAKWAASELDLERKILFREMQVYDLARTEERWDLVWFMGVFYHLRYPMLALDIVARRTKKLLVFQALTIPGQESADLPEDLEFHERHELRKADWPKMAFIEDRLAGDPTNWWDPSHGCIEAMLRSSGFRILSNPGHEIYLCETSEQPHSPALTTILEKEYSAATGRPPQPPKVS